MELVSAWAGVEVEETAMYGLRQYETGARLLSHVDRLTTHAVSLIVNIAQENLANPWPIEVFDHADRLHEVTMDAGEIVYYESANNLHSRNRPLTCKKGGCRFINLFTHYRPVQDGGDWYKNLADMPNRPPPLVKGQVDFDARESACVFFNETDADDYGVNGDNVLGVGKVKCEDRRLGPYLSPTLFKAQEADDLFRWWKAAANPHLIGFDKNKEPVYHPAAAALAAAYESPAEHKPEPVTKQLAYDQHEDCQKWAIEGECKNNAEYMRGNCERSCNNAAIASSKAARKEQEVKDGDIGDDTHEKCNFWAHEGECDANPDYMSNNCKTSCHNLSLMNNEVNDGDSDESGEEQEQDVQVGKDEL